jgi:hypothetical protein
MDSVPTIWIIIGVVLLLLFFVVVIVGVGLAIFFVSRKRKKAALAAASSSAPAFDVVASPAPEIAPADVMAETPALESAPVAFESAPPAFDSAPAEFEPVVTPAEPNALEASADQSAPDSGALDFDPSRTVAITREKTVTISYGIIKFTSGVLAGQEFEVKPEGAYIGREPSLSQIVVADPRISKRHLWIGVRDGLVKIVDQESRNGTFINDPRSDRVTEASLNSGDTVILGESDVARFEYQM